MLVVLIALAATTAALPASAHAGRYTVHSCRLPDGSAAPLLGYSRNEPTPWSNALDRCSTQGHFIAYLDAAGTVGAGTKANWRLTAPTGTAIRRLTGHMYMHARARTTTSSAYHITEAVSSGGQGVFAGSGRDAEAYERGSSAFWNSPANAFDTGLMSPAATYTWQARCGPDTLTVSCPGLSGGARAQVVIHRVAAELEDLHDPEVGEFGGPLTAVGRHRGIEAFTLRATDRGAGVYRLIVELGGREVLTQVIDRSAGECADAYPANADHHDFTRPVPCKLDVNGVFELDTRFLPEGEHDARFIIEDAAGNRRVALHVARGWIVDNEPDPSPPPPRDPAPAARPPAAAVASVAELHLGCGRRMLSLISATAAGPVVRLTGVVAPRLRARRITILAGGRRIAATVARADGFFDAIVPRPPRRSYRRIRYRAAIDGMHSVALKLPQDLATHTALQSGAEVVLAGRVRRRGHRAVTVRRIACGRYTVVGRGVTSRSGRYRLRIPVPGGTRAGLYRVETRVRGYRAYARARAITFADPATG